MKISLQTSGLVSMVSLFTMGFLASCGAKNALEDESNNIQEAWKPHDAPFHLDSSFNRKLAALPQEAELKKIPWADTYWPSYQGGISARWNSSNPQPFSYQSPSLSKLKNMSAQEISQLSPAEKFDILRGDYSYGLVRSEWNRTSPQDETWEGICHGWAPAAALYEEPKPVVVKNRDGISIPFGSSDIKALLSFYQGNVGNAPTQFLGLRCNIKIENYNDARANADDCKGVNAGAFHIVLANQIGIKNESFIADVTRDFEVWNHPISGYSSTFQSKAGVSATAAPGTVREILVQTRMNYSVEVNPQWNALAGFESSFTSQRQYQYVLELNAAGEIIGGEWLQNDRPDFLWNQQKAPFEGSFSALGGLYNLSINQ